MSVVAGAAAIVVGLVVCFRGQRLARVALVLTGFAAGALLALNGLQMLPNASDTFRYIVAGVAGVLGAVLALLLYGVGVFLLGALAGAFLAGLSAALMRVEVTALVVFIAALAGGVTTLLAQRWLLSVLTAFAGAWLALSGLLAVLHTGADGWLERLAGKVEGTDGLIVGSWLLLGVLGSFVQLRRRH